MLRAGYPMMVFGFLAVKKLFSFSFLKLPGRFWGLYVFLFIIYHGINLWESRGVKRPEGESAYSASTTADVKMSGAVF